MNYTNENNFKSFMDYVLKTKKVFDKELVWQLCDNAKKYILKHFMCPSFLFGANLQDTILGLDYIPINVISKENRTLLHYVQDAETAEYLLNKAKELGILNTLLNEKDNLGNTALHLANKIEVVKVLLKYGANNSISILNDKGESILFYKNKEVTKELLKYFTLELINVSNINGETALHVVNNVESIKLLIEAGINLNTKNINGSSVLHICTVSKVAKYLIENKADVNAADNSGNTVLHLCKNFRIIEYALKAGANVNAQNRAGNTALHLSEDNMITQKLIKYHGDVNIRNNSYEIPLHLAKSVKIAKTLLKNNSDINATNLFGTSVMKYHKNKNELICKMLKLYGHK